MNDRNNEVVKLIGDFYENHANQNYAGMGAVIENLEYMLISGEISSTPFMEYFRDLYSGRSAYNTMLGTLDYPPESIIRELFQNAFDSYYFDKNIKLVVDFKGNGVISFVYNEIGFTLEQFLYFLSVGRCNTDRLREGRFGVGAKSVFLNTASFSMRSNSFSFTVENNNGILAIKNICLNNPSFKGTEIVIAVDDARYDEIYGNFTSLTQKRGSYINIMDLCFAFNRKKVLNVYENDSVCNDRTFNIAVTEKGQFVTVYQIANYRNKSLNHSTVRFTHDGHSVVDFICHEYEGFVFLVPFAMSANRRAGIIQVLFDKYNYFSTYELTGLLKTENESFLNSKLSAFFISIPNTFITSLRTGIRHDNEFEVQEKVHDGLMDLISANKRYFVISLKENPKMPDCWFLRPESYIFEFVKKFLWGCEIGKSLQDKFLQSISFSFPDEDKLIKYNMLLKTAFRHETTGVTKSEHEDGSAYEKYIDGELERMEQVLSEFDYKTICVSYTWFENGQDSKEFLYKFYRGDRIYVFSSKYSKTDFNLSQNFKSIVDYHLTKILPNQTPEDEQSLTALFSLLDSEYAGNYSLDLTDDILKVRHENEIIETNLSELKIRNLKTAMEQVQLHRSNFNAYPAYLRLVDMVVDRFADGQKSAEVLKAIKRQGVQINTEYGGNFGSGGCTLSFTAYDWHFSVAEDFTFSDLLFLCEDRRMLIESGVLLGKRFDATLECLRYLIDSRTVIGALGSRIADEITAVRRLSRIYMSDLEMDLVVFLDNSDRIVWLQKPDEQCGYERDAYRYVLLNADYGKRRLADILEWVVTGKNSGILKRYFMIAPEVNRMIFDQLPGNFKLFEYLRRRELEELRALVQRLKPYRENPEYKNYFAKDLNFKFHGYGGLCSFCGFESQVLNSFSLEDFSIPAIRTEREDIFNFTLYLCANDTTASKCWSFESLTIGGLKPFEWLEEIIIDSDEILIDQLVVKLEYREQIAFGLPDVFSDTSSETVLATPKRIKSFRLTPLMAAKWIEDNV